MEKIILTIKDNDKLGFFLELINQFDFIEVQKTKLKQPSSIPYDFFASAGLWKNRDVDAKDLRRKAWKNKN